MEQQQEQKTKKKTLVLTREQRQLVLMNLFRKHIGRDKAITRLEVFESVFGDISKWSELQIFFLWCKLKIDLNWLRRTTNYFVVSMPKGQTWLYFIVKDWDDAEHYIKVMENNKRKCEYMKRRCEKAVEEKFYLRLEK